MLIVTKYAKRIVAYYAVNDRWIPEFARDQILGIINRNGGEAVICNEGFPHAFSLGILTSMDCAYVSSWTTDVEDLVMDFNIISSDHSISDGGEASRYVNIGDSG